MALVTGKFYNLRVGRPQPHIDREVRALLESGPAVLGLCEAVGYRMPGVDGFKLWRDTSTPGRANIAVYTNTDHHVPEETQRWHDMRETWSRTEHPGTHPPRSWWEGRLDGIQVLVGHQPPQGTDNVIPSQREGIALCARRMRPGDLDRPRLALADWNRSPTAAGPGPRRLAVQIGGRRAGTRIDAAVWRGRDAHLAGVRYVTRPQGVPLLSDHWWGALVVHLDVGESWVT